MKRGDVHLVSLEPAEGHEQRGCRPALVVSPPITTGGEFARRIGFAVPISGAKTTGFVRCDQPRVLDLRARQGRKVDTLPQAIVEEALAKVITIFE